MCQICVQAENLNKSNHLTEMMDEVTERLVTQYLSGDTIMKSEQESDISNVDK